MCATDKYVLQVLQPSKFAGWEATIDGRGGVSEANEMDTLASGVAPL